MSIKIGINGFGRIGRILFRILMRDSRFDVVAVNDIVDTPTLAYLLKYDSVHGRYPGSVEAAEGAIIVDGKKILTLSEKDPAGLPWKDLGVEIAVESTGIFRKKAELEKHIKAGAKKVLLTVPAKDEIDAMIIVGVNEDTLGADDRIVSNASCTTNCLAPMVKVLNDTFGVESGLMTTIHSYTADQCLVDAPHKDPRRGRAAAVNIVPTTTGAAKAIGKIIPELSGKLNGLAVRVPTPCGSITDLTVYVKKDATVEEVNAAMKRAASAGMKGILEYSDDGVVLQDIVGHPASCIFDAPSTYVAEKRLIKVVGWYDNEWGYCCRLADLIALMAK
ncbi:MAG: type I glyceraldehyde-3-phosphate dehydrogenase [Candidatus Tritonobacter lacicola]|nr:type I glyceraldehyde-3-phosphate dehydrogenase [Candidatus Tritonobacter lacicola]